MTASAPLATTPAVSAPVEASQPQESDLDRSRRAAGAEFDRDVAELGKKADAADVAWNRYLAGCRENITTATAVAGVADRNWLVFAGASVTTTQWTNACAEAGTFFSLLRQVRDGMCVAEERARHGWVLPGIQRDVRHKYRLDWDGWDATCR